MFKEIEKRRIEAGLTQIQLCNAAKVHPTTYSAIKAGRSSGHGKTLQRLTDALDTLARALEAAE